MRRRPISTLACLALAGGCLLAPAPAGAAEAAARRGMDYRPGEVVVRYEAGAGRSVRAAAQRVGGAGEPRTFAPRTRVLKVRGGRSVAATVRELRRRPGVASATPNWIARASYIPDDPGFDATPTGWQTVQWNFATATGVNAPVAWDNLIAAGRSGGKGTVVAVLDTGVAYRDRSRFRRSPDFSKGRFVQGYDFVDHDRFPDDHNGHGTHVSGTIAETANNGTGLTGLAYGTRIMPVRVLDRLGEGDSAAISSGIRYAARRGAHVINLSFEFGASVTRRDIPDILEALRYARRKGALVVGASGNAAATAVAYPARADEVLSVGATTEHLCQADYSNDGQGLDVAAPGGGPDAAVPDDPNCRPDLPAGRDIYQMTFTSSVRKFGFPGGFTGTSMAAPHVSATAALVIASGVLGRKPSPRDVEARLKATARDLGPAGADDRYGAGLIDAGAATTPAAPVPAPVAAG
jgi:serine protease